MSDGLDARIERVVSEVLGRRDRDLRFKVEDIHKDLSPSALQQMNDYLSSINPLNASLRQVRGLAQFTALAAPRIAAAQSTSSITFTDLATVGPELTLLPAGAYLVFWGASIEEKGIMGLSVNGAAPVLWESLFALGQWVVGTTSTASADYSRAALFMLTNETNTIRAKYRTFDTGARARRSHRRPADVARRVDLD